MGLPRWTGPSLFVAGGAVLVLAAARGEASLSLVVILPVVVATGALGAIAILLLVAAFVLTFFAWPFRVLEDAAAGLVPEPLAPEPTVPSSRRGGGVLFLGPVPIVFGSDAKVTRGMLLLGFLLFFALLALTVFFLFPGA